jgi:hypothetical protein
MNFQNFSSVQWKKVFAGKKMPRSVAGAFVHAIRRCLVSLQ